MSNRRGLKGRAEDVILILMIGLRISGYEIYNRSGEISKNRLENRTRGIRYIAGKFLITNWSFHCLTLNRVELYAHNFMYDYDDIPHFCTHSFNSISKTFGFVSA